MLHKNLSLADIHAIHNWKVATLVELTALVVTAEDRGKVAWVLDGNKLYFLANEVAPTWAPLGATDVVGIPIGGTTGQLLAKVSNADYDVHWIDAPVSPPPTGDTEMAESSGTFVPKLRRSSDDFEAIANIAIGNWHRLGNRVFFDLHYDGQFAPEDVGSSFYIGNFPFEQAQSVGNYAEIACYIADYTFVQNGTDSSNVTAYLQQPDAISFPVRVMFKYQDPLSSPILQNPRITFMAGATQILHVSGSFMAVPVV